MTREAALAWLQERFAHLYSRAGMVVTDVAPNGLKPVLDDTWAALNVAPLTEVPASDSDRFYAFARYYAYWHACNYLVTRYSKTIAGMSLQTNQVYAGAKQMLDLALAEAKSYGLTMPKPSYSEITLNPRKSLNVVTLGGWTEFG